MTVFKTEGIVLKQFDLGEADKIITLYTGNRGKVRAVARGARKTKSSISGVVQPFSYCRFKIYKGKSLDRINHVQNIYSFSILREDLDKMAYASYMAEFIEKVGMEDAPNETLFSLLLMAFYKLISAEHNNLKYINLIFRVKALVFLGHRPELEYCLECGKRVKVKSRNFLSISRGGIYCSHCQEQDNDLYILSGEALQILKKLINSDLKISFNLKLSTAAYKQLDSYLKKFIIYHLDLNLKSEKFLHIIADLG